MFPTALLLAWISTVIAEEEKAAIDDATQTTSPSVWYVTRDTQACKEVNCYGSDDIHRFPALYCDKLYWGGINDPRSDITIECDAYTIEANGHVCYCKYPTDPSQVESVSGSKTYRTKRYLNSGLGECKPGFVGLRTGGDGNTGVYPCLRFNPDNWCARLSATATDEQKQVMSNLGFSDPCIPGAEYIGMGWDITKDSADPTMLASVGRPQLWRLSYDQGLSETTVLGKRFTHPSNVKVRQLNSQSTADTAKTFKSSKEYSKTLAGEIGVTGVLKGVQLDGMVKGSQTVSKAFTENRNAATMTVNKELYNVQVDLLASQHSWMADFAGYNRGVRPSLGEEDKKTDLSAAMWSFVQEFGTHVVTQVTMGARITFELETLACTSQAETKREIEVNVGATLPKVPLGGNVGTSVGQTDSTSTEGSSSTCRQSVSGGTTSHCQSGVCSKDNCDYDQWTSSVAMANSVELVPIKFKVQSLEEIFQKTLTVEHIEPFEDALEQHLHSVTPSTASVTCDSIGVNKAPTSAASRLALLLAAIVLFARP